MNRRFVAIMLVCLAAAGHAPAAETNLTRVVRVRDPLAVRVLEVDAGHVRAMLATGIQAWTGAGDLAAAWRSLVSSNDVVGIKVSTAAAPLHASHPALVDAIVDGLLSAGVAPTNIVVWDRDPIKLHAAGYEPARRFRLAAVVGDTGWDPDAFYESALVGKLIWGDRLFGKSGAEINTRSHLPQLLTKTITKLINLPVLQDHPDCGLAGGLYNLSFAMVDNARRFEVPGQRGAPDLAAIAALPEIRRKLVLTVMDALIGGYAGGPGFKPEFSWPCASLYLSADPVAVDSLCLDLIETQRHDANIPALSPRASYLSTATRLGLGQSDRAQIDLIER